MNIFHKVTLESLKKNRTRTAVTIVGIVLSAALICAVTTSVSSFMNYALQNVIYNNGSWHAVVGNADWETHESLLEMEEIEGAVYGQQIGYAETESLNEFKPYLFLLGMSEGFADTMPIHLLDGEYPDAPDEIAIPEHLSLNGGVYYRIGDTVTLDIGTRQLDDWTMWQDTPCYTTDGNGEATLQEETLVVRETRTFTVVGIYERPDFESYSAPGYTALTAADSHDMGRYSYDIYYTLHDPKDAYDFVHTYPEYWGATNDDYLMMQGAYQFDGLYGLVYGLAAVFIGLIMFGSVSLIYNAFSISVSERTKQFGLLSSVGATRKQLRRMVFFESFAVSAIGIPLGILIGIAGIGVTLLVIGEKFMTSFGFHVPMRVCVSPFAILAACIVALVTVLISAWIPSVRATSVTAVEAIRQNKDIKTEKKPIRTPKFIYKLFGLSGMLAHKHYKRSKKKYRATIVSLFMSIVLFISASAFTDYLLTVASGGLGTYGYDLTFYANGEDLKLVDSPDALLDTIAENEYVDTATYLQSYSLLGFIAKEYLHEDVIDFYPYSDGTNPNIPEDWANIHTYVYFVEDTAFRTLLAEYALSEAEFMNPEAPLAIAVDGMTRFNAAEERYEQVNALRSDNSIITVETIRELEGYYYAGPEETGNGEMLFRYQPVESDEPPLDLTAEEAKITFPMQAGKVIYEKPYFIGEDHDIIYIYPYSMRDYVLPKDAGLYDAIYYKVQAEEHAACYTSLKKTLDNMRMHTDNLHNYAADVEQERSLVTIVQVFSYGFVVLISLIAAANVFNTISTNIALRRREFAMLKSIGMTAGDFNRMMHFECLLYGSKALLLGLPVSFLVTLLIHKAVLSGYDMPFYLPWEAVAIAVLSVFAVVFATMLYAMQKIKADNPIDALKDENL